MNAETIMVEPINKEKLAKYFERFIPKNENQEFMIDTDSVFITPYQSLLLDNECCGGNLTKKFNRDKEVSEWAVSFAIRKSTKTEFGDSFPMFIKEYFEIFESELRDNDLLLKPTSLKDFMKGRFNYNPRIQKNTGDIVRLINEIISINEEIKNELS